MTDFMLAVTTIGSPQSMFILSVVICIVLFIHKKYHHVAQFALFMVLGALSVYGLKLFFAIPRPAGGLIQEYGYGFPSGHTTISTLFFFLIIFSYENHIKNKAWRASYILFCILSIALISFSRIYLGVHTWLDLAGGFALGTIWFLLSVIFYNLINKKK